MTDEFSFRFPEFLRKERKRITKALKEAYTEQDITYLRNLRKLTYLLSLAFIDWSEGGT
ncbi:MAG: hypothetical protein HXS54_01120 [Theionarchaea archaeon]|nr:hypothetical protein [Theionarchaea archaeon]